ncbi:MULTISPECIES: peptide ABC transporter substrate-binding protein [Modicisalibacter]|uniref:peptide ABC transporter substrate-binding protein n=1 Tax=Modicisalibacter TaxID=574347 RepID=UPI00100AA9E5|nr:MULTISPECIES: peptide ABC transporter substrate-binding protein [Halomonadaceae]MBZ9573141.1 peptide ABC transporter substrate-binding protein [Modicisalibacter sp. MOD 31.J]
MSPTRLATALAVAASMTSLSLQAQTLNIGISGSPSSLSPARVTGGVWEEDVLRDIFEGLVAIDADGRMIPGMASDWEISDDGTVYTFHLRDAEWSDGEPVTADDFVFAFRHQLDPATASNYAHRLYPLVNARAINSGDKPLDALGAESLDDGRTLRLTLAEPAAYFFKTLVLPFGYPLPEHAVERYGDAWSKPANIVVNGAFKPVDWVSNSTLETVKNPRYHDADAVTLDGVDFHPMEDKQAGIQRFRAGELDILRDYPAARYPWLEENLPEATHLAPSLGTYYYVFNLADDSPVADPRIREALSLAIRREVIADQLLEGAVEPAYALVPTGTDHYQPQPQPGLQQPIDERQARARQLMKEAGYDPDHPLHLTLRYNSGDEHRQIAVAIAAMWKPLGVEAELRHTEASVHYEDLMAGDFQVARAAWISSYDDAQNFLQLLSAESNNYGDYQNDQYDALMAESDVTQDADEREALMEHAERIGLADYPLTPIYVYTSRNLVDPALDGWHDNALNMHPSRWVHIGD